MQVAINKKFSHDLSHQHLTTMDFFRLQPLSCIECVAGDSMKVNVQSLIESAPLATKVYGSYHLDLHAFFVPFRLLWNNWTNYQYSNTGSATEFGLPCFDVSLKQNSDIFSPASDTSKSKARRAVFGSLGYPVNQLSKEYASVPNLNAKRLCSLMPARAYQQIWWDWFRDSVALHENSKASFLRTVGGEETNVNILTTLFEPRYRTFRKDYITTILSGASAVVPGAGAEVDNTLADVPVTESASGKRGLYYGDGDTFVNTSPVGSSSSVTVEQLFQSIKMPVLRGALALQRWLERLGVSGSRPLERIVSNFGVRPEPVRLQMAEFIGTKRINIGVDGLINTGSQALLSNPGSTPSNPFGSDYESYFGTFTGKSSAGGRTEDWSYNANEHGYFMVIGSIMPNYINDGYLDPIFFRGLSAKSEGSKDFFVPEMDGSGYVPVLLGHIANPLRGSGSTAWKSADIDQVVGYQPRYEDYRYIMDKISGDFNEPASRAYLRNMAFVRNLTETLEPSAVFAGLNLTTPDEDDRALFDNHFQVTDQLLDHFIVNNFIVVDAVRPISASVLPTELSNLANKDLTEVSRGGIRL